MSADKRQVSTDALETLGTIIGDNEKRDAIHLAVLPVKAGKPLMPGQYINLKDGLAYPDSNGLGIVDPFIGGPIEPGQNFWMVLKPRIIKSLRHVWNHPSFPDEQVKNSEDFLSPEKAHAMHEITAIASGFGLSYDEIMSAANNYLDYNDYLIQGGKFEGESIPDIFWSYYTAITGRVNTTGYSNFLGCSC